MPVQLQITDGIAVLTLHRPERRNALTMDDWLALGDAATRVGDARALVVTGSGGHFSAGMDLSLHNPLIQRIGPAIVEGKEEPARKLIEELKSCVQALADLEIPTFAAIEGACVGGGLEIALACDVRIAARDARIALTEVRAGMIPDIGGCVRLTRLVGPGRASDLAVTARTVDGAEAYALGIVERLVEPGEALAVATAAAQATAANGPTAVRLALRTIRLAPDLGLAEALSVETRGGVLALISGEPQEGIAAFLEKRPPRWS